MKKNALLKKMSSLGYPLFEKEEDVEANRVLAEVVKGKESRFWEGFPLILANSIKKNLFNYEIVLKHLNNKTDRDSFRNLFIMSLAVFTYVNLDFTSLNRAYFSRFYNNKLFDEILERLRHNKDLPKSLNNISSSRILSTFKSYFQQIEQDTNDYIKMKNEYDLEYSLSQIFARKQKILFMKKLKGEKLTKTEREYFSRVIRKKVLALSNPELHELAVRLVKR